MGFDRVRTFVADRCSTEYAVSRVAGETFSNDAKVIGKRLALTDEMRLIVMFEEGFPTNGYIDCLDFLRPLENSGYTIDVLSLGKLRTMVETVRKLTNFFMSIKDGVYPYLKRMSAPVMSFPEVQRRIDTILDKFGDVKDTASDNCWRSGKASSPRRVRSPKGRTPSSSRPRPTGSRTRTPDFRSGTASC